VVFSPETEGSSWIWLAGKRVRRIYKYEKKGTKNVECAEGIVVGWLSAEENDGTRFAVYCLVTRALLTPCAVWAGLALWHVEHEDGDEEDLEEFELIEAIKLAEEAALADPEGAVRSIAAAMAIWSVRRGLTRCCVAGEGGPPVHGLQALDQQSRQGRAQERG
jgi:hypothetical protein